MKYYYIGFILLINLPLMAELVPGNKYDFVLKNGTEYKDALLMQETKSSYLIQTDALNTGYLVIEKDSVLRIPDPSQPVGGMRHKHYPPKWYFYSNTEIQSTVAGKLNTYTAGSFIGTSLNLARRFESIPYIGVNSLATSLHYTPIARDDRRVDIMTYGLGPKWVSRLGFIGSFEFYLTAMPAVSMVRFVSYNYTSTPVIFGGILEVGVHWMIDSSLLLTFNAGGKYAGEKNLLIVTYNASIGVGYVW